MAQKGFLSVAAKHIRRQQEKLMQKLGKSEHTTDEEFQEYVANFKKQEAHAQRLSKEAQNFVRAIKALAQASRSLGDAIKEIYEPDWPESDMTQVALDNIHLILEDAHQKLEDQFSQPIHSYIQKFPDVQARIDKRERRTLDYDHARRNKETNREKQSAAKQQQYDQEFEDAEKAFSEINQECHETLPAFYNSRIVFYASTLQSFFTTLSDADANCSKSHDQLRTIMDNLTEQSSSLVAAGMAAGGRSPSLTRKKLDPAVQTGMDHAPSDDEDNPFAAARAAHASGHVVASSGTPSRRIATHPYSGQDDDELSFQKGDIIEVIPFDDPTEADDGWLNGRLNGRTGVFPSNFTDAYAG